MPVEAAIAAGTMEITVSKFELLRELTATQGVVERKTTTIFSKRPQTACPLPRPIWI